MDADGALDVRAGRVRRSRVVRAPRCWRYVGGKRSADNGGKRAVLREEHEVSRKAIAQGRPECSRCPVCSCAFLFAQIARETAGAASTRSSLRPLFRSGREVASQPRAIRVARSRSHTQSSSPAKAGDPVFQRRQWLNREAAAYWIPACAGMTMVHCVAISLSLRAKRSNP